MRKAIGIAMVCCCSIAAAASMSSTFAVRVALNDYVCLTGSASTASDQAVVTRTTEDGSYCFGGRPYRFLHLAGSASSSEPAGWGVWPTPGKGIQVYYDATLAPPVRIFNTIDDDGTSEVQVIW